MVADCGWRMTGRMSLPLPVKSIVPPALLLKLIVLPGVREETAPLVKLDVPLLVVTVPADGPARASVPAPARETVPAPEIATVPVALPVKLIELPAGIVIA